MSKTVADRIADLRSDNSQLVKEAIRALSYLGEAALPELLAALHDESIPFTPLAETFKQMGNTAIEPLSDLMVKTNPLLQPRVVQVLGFTRNDRAVVPLLTALQTSDEYVRQEIAKALGNFTDLRAVGPLLGLLTKDTINVRANAAQALGAYSRDSRVAPALLDALKDKSPIVRGGAVQGLAHIANDNRVPEALNAATADPDEDVRILAAAALQHQRGDLMAFNRVKMNVDQTIEDEVQRILADGKVNESDIDSMRHSNPKVRARLMEIVSEFGKGSVFKLILPGLNDINPAVRTSALEAVVRMGSRALPELDELVTHPSAITRATAAEAVGTIGDVNGIDTLLKMLQDKEAKVVLSALAALSKFPAEERTILALQHMTRTDNADIAQKVSEVLQQYGVQPESANPVARFFRRLLGGD